MATYISLLKLTEQGVKDVKNLPARFDDAFRALEERGGKGIAAYLTLGEYDFAVIWEAPDDQAAAVTLLETGAAGLVRTTTLKAFTQQEFKEIIGKMS